MPDIKEIIIPTAEHNPLFTEYGREIWLFTDNLTRVSPWLLLFRESTRDDDFELLTHHIPLVGYNNRTENLLVRLYEHFGLSEPGELEPGWFDSEADMAIKNLFAGRLRMFNLGLEHRARLVNPNSLMWNRPVLADINNDNVSQELVRNTIIDELGTMLLARWQRADIGNSLLMEYNYLEQRLIELGAAMDGAAEGVVSVVTGIVDIAVLLYKGVKAWIEFNVRMVKASYEFIADLSVEDVLAIGENVRSLVGEVITTAQEIKDKIILGAKIFNAAMTDGLVREAIVQYMDGYTESVSHIQNIHNIANFVGAAVGEILLFIAFAPGSLAKLAAQGTVMIGRFSIKLIQLISRLGRAILKRMEDAATAVKQYVQVIPESLGSAAKKNDSAENGFMDTSTPSGSYVHHNDKSTALGSDDATVGNYNVAKETGHGHNVIVHGSSPDYDAQGGVFLVDGNATHSQQVADAVLSNPAYKEGDPVCLGSCWSGSNGTAQEVANALNAPVTAPTRPVRFNETTGQWEQMSDALMKRKYPEYADIKPEMKTFYPEGH